MRTCPFSNNSYIASVNTFMLMLMSPSKPALRVYMEFTSCAKAFPLENVKNKTNLGLLGEAKPLSQSETKT